MKMATSQNFRFMALLLFSLVFSFGVNGMINNGDTKLDPNSILKTIVVGDETIDCVDIYKQPAFNHPLLRNHTLQLKPSSYPIESKPTVSLNEMKLAQMWHKNREYCPKGTVAIFRSSMTDVPPKNAYDRLRVLSNANPNPLLRIPHPEFATVALKDLNIYGVKADMSVWNPKVEANESSSSQVWVTDGGGDKVEAIEAGWMVTPAMPYPAIFTYWTVDGYGGSGCYNLDCPGFVQTSNKFGPGSQLDPASIYGGGQYFTTVKIHKDFKTGNWWLNIGGSEIGYWPVELFTYLKTSAQVLEWGGRVVNTNPNGFHTRTQMGSGHFPSEGEGHAAWFHNLEYIDENGDLSHVGDRLSVRATRPECYDVKVQESDKDVSASFLYGGPGYSLGCLFPR